MPEHELDAESVIEQDTAFHGFRRGRCGPLVRELGRGEEPRLRHRGPMTAAMRTSRHASSPSALNRTSMRSRSVCGTCSSWAAATSSSTNNGLPSAVSMMRRMAASVAPSSSRYDAI